MYPRRLRYFARAWSRGSRRRGRSSDPDTSAERQDSPPDRSHARAPARASRARWLAAARARQSPAVRARSAARRAAADHRRATAAALEPNHSRRPQHAVPRLPGGGQPRVGVEDQLVHDPGHGLLGSLERREIGLFEDHVDSAPAPDLDVIVVADDLLLKAELGVLADLIEQRL